VNFLFSRPSGILSIQSPALRAAVLTEIKVRLLFGHILSWNLRRIEMRIQIGILTTIVASATLWGVAIAQPAATHTTAAPAATTEDCRKSGNEVSALIDNRAGSPNLPAARAVFQVGIMECMEGDDSAASKYYQQAKELLANDQPVTPSSPQKK
jgi:hypothetical protein